jgi:hypothetical protein
MIIGLQLVAIIFSLIMIYFAYLHFMRGELSKTEIITWWVIWAVTIVITIFPELLSGFARTFSITRVFDLMVVGGFILVIFMSYKAYIGTKSLEHKIDEFIRKESLRDFQNGKKNK